MNILSLVLLPIFTVAPLKLAVPFVEIVSTSAFPFMFNVPELALKIALLLKLNSLAMVKVVPASVTFPPEILRVEVFKIPPFKFVLLELEKFNV